jgi:GNAT superfamily N-acetyltransferase
MIRYELKQGEFELTTDRSKMQIEVIHNFLRKSYWASKRSEEVIRRSIDHSLPFGIFAGQRQIAFARAITDYATFAWIADVFVDDDFRGKGLGKWLIDSMLRHPELQGMRRWVLATKDAHSLYATFGFNLLNKPERWMEVDFEPNP